MSWKAHRQTWSTDIYIDLNDNNNNRIKAYFTEMTKPTVLNKFEDIIKDSGINLADFLTEPRSSSQVQWIPFYSSEKLTETIRAGITGLFDSGTFSLNKKPLQTDEIIPTKYLNEN